MRHSSPADGQGRHVKRASQVHFKEWNAGHVSRRLERYWRSRGYELKIKEVVVVWSSLVLKLPRIWSSSMIVALLKSSRQGVTETKDCCAARKEKKASNDTVVLHQCARCCHLQRSCSRLTHEVASYDSDSGWPLLPTLLLSTHVRFHSLNLENSLEHLTLVFPKQLSTGPLPRPVRLHSNSVLEW